MRDAPVFTRAPRPAPRFPRGHRPLLSIYLTGTRSQQRRHPDSRRHQRVRIRLPTGRIRALVEKYLSLFERSELRTSESTVVERERGAVSLELDVVLLEVSVALPEVDILPLELTLSELLRRSSTRRCSRRASAHLRSSCGVKLWVVSS